MTHWGLMESPATVAGAVLAHVLDALVAAGADPVSTSYVAAGSAVWDDCCGQLVVAPELVFRAQDPFPTAVTSDPRCDVRYIGVNITVLLLRCVPVVNDAGEPPSQEAIDAAYAVILKDAAIVWNAMDSRALLGEDAAGDPVWERAGLEQTWVGADGGCIGTETRVQLGIPLGQWCVEPAPPE